MIGMIDIRRFQDGGESTAARMRRLGTVAPILCLLAVTAAAQPPAATPTTAVLVNLTVKPDVDRTQVASMLPEEVRATVRLYLDGRIQQWFSRSDGHGVVFIVNAPDAGAAKALMEQLPLAKAGLVNLEYTGLGPLSPLRTLLPTPASGPKGHD